eukprot:CAMPEP_0167786024 /NCGR_PEP_ID=MMETSP0111_2-20121227/8551_1 /TAXON_ID=91324 /ORGANISM="Lotharella globosa, Strain CCCM811" /LENGTH=315 /DNA_ID=CAMNT_0007677337 /DNA_START=112 /DNA_END=1059 /DNA_ORIENTATION=+
MDLPKREAEKNLEESKHQPEHDKRTEIGEKSVSRHVSLYERSSATAVPEDFKKGVTGRMYPPSFTVAPTLNIGDKKYYKSLKMSTCCHMQECCFPSVSFKTSGDATYRIQHGCACLPCCFGFTAYDSKEKIGSYSLGGCTDAPCCGPLVVDGKFLDSTGQAKFFLKHEAVCCDGCKICCASTCSLCGCLSCYKYYCSSEQYREYRQPIYRKLETSAPVAYFKYVDRIRGPCCADERLSMVIEPADELSEDDFQLLSFYLILTSGYANWELGLNFSLLASNSITPYGVESIDEAVGIHKRSLTEKDAVNQGLINMY